MNALAAAFREGALRGVLSTGGGRVVHGLVHHVVLAGVRASLTLGADLEDLVWP